MDLQHLRASDGTGEAVLAHVQSVRSIGSTVLDLDNVDNWNSKCIVVTGTPAANGYIASAGMTIMYGHITAGDFIIDGYAPGYSDNGNTTTEIAIVKMCTAWADTLVNILAIAHQDDGKLKTDSLDHFFKPVEIGANGIASGGIIAQTAGLTASFSNLVYYLNGLRYTKTGVANRVYTASKDTYVDIASDGVLDYTEVANGAASPALTAGHLRLAKVVTGGAAITSVVQYGVDSLQNIIYPLGVLDQSNIQNPYRFSAYMNAATAALSASTLTRIPVDTKEFDPAGLVDVTTNKGRITITRTGTYMIGGRFRTNGVDAGGYLRVSVNVGGVTRKSGLLNRQGAGASTVGSSGAESWFLLELRTGDQVEVMMETSNANNATGGNINDTWIQGYLVSR